MQHLTLVGLTEDESKLVLISDSGEEFTVAADARLRAALRGDHARLGQLEIQMDSALRPRDIQARIRSGESPEAVAQAAQTTVDRIMSYATPVLAERAHIAERAQRASVRRRSGEGPARILYDAVADQLRGKNVDPDSVAWDSWRRDDGRWTLVADYRVGDRPRHAEFVFDVQGRYVVAEDEESRWLLGEAVAKKAQPRPGGAGARRLAAVRDEEQLTLGDDAIEMVTGATPEGSADPDERTTDLSTTARELRGTPPTERELGAAGDADWMATQATDRPPARHEPDDHDEAGVAEPTGRTQEEPREAPAVAEDDESAGEPETPRKNSRKGRRASVPSWDEIMFGGGRRSE